MPNGVTDCFKDIASSVLVGRYADFASLSAEIVHGVGVASCTTFEIQSNEGARYSGMWYPLFSFSLGIF